MGKSLTGQGEGEKWHGFDGGESSTGNWERTGENGHGVWQDVSVLGSSANQLAPPATKVVGYVPPGAGVRAP